MGSDELTSKSGQSLLGAALGTGTAGAWPQVEAREFPLGTEVKSFVQSSERGGKKSKPPRPEEKHFLICHPVIDILFREI